MKIFKKRDFKSLMEDFPGGGIVFAEYEPDILNSSLMVTDGDFGAREVVPHDGEVFDFDWNIDEYLDGALFAVFDNNDILQMIQTLTSGIKVDLKAWFDKQ
jgi:hypothetical protein